MQSTLLFAVTYNLFKHCYYIVTDMQKRATSLHRKTILLLAFVWLCVFAGQQTFAQNAAEDDYKRLYQFLAGYLAHDLELQKLSLTAQAKQLSLDSTKISSSLALSLSTGTVTIQSTDAGTTVTLSPNATLELPLQNDTAVSVKMPLTITSDSKTVKNGTIELSTGIITGTAKTKRVTILQAERALLEAQRAAEDRALAAEKAFYTELKKLYGYAVTVIDEKNDLQDDDDSFRKLITQGYSKDSAKYRQSFLTLQHDVFDTVQAQRRLERETASFARRCNISYDFPLTTEGSTLAEIEQAYRAAIEFLPVALPQAEGLDVLSFPEEAYTETESATWSKYIAELKRAADCDLTLKATGTYTFNDTSANSDTIGAGLSLDWNGLTASAGVALPTGTKMLDAAEASDSKNPLYTLSLGWSPQTLRQAKIDREQEKIDRKLEDIAIKSARDNYESDVFSKQTSLRDLMFSRHLYTEEVDMYTQLEKDMQKWYEQGIVSRADYFDTRDNRDKARLNLMINAAEVIIYNNETRLLFHTDGAETAKKSKEAEE